jgi:hypothetical protein
LCSAIASETAQFTGATPSWLRAGEPLLDDPFARPLYPRALGVLALLRRFGSTWLITEGDGVMSPHKLRRAGLWDAVAGRVRIDVHKEQMPSDIHQACSADHDVMVDDKLRILHAIRQQWHRGATTVQPMQGHDANSESKSGKADRPTSPSRRSRLLAEGDCALVRAWVWFAPDLQNAP